MVSSCFLELFGDGECVIFHLFSGWGVADSFFSFFFSVVSYVNRFPYSYSFDTFSVS